MNTQMVDRLNEKINVNYINQNKEKSNGLSLKPSAVFSAQIMAKDEKSALLKTEDGFSFAVENDKLKGEVGETVEFEVLKNDKSGFLLKQISKDKAVNDNLQAEIKATKQLFKERKMIETDEKGGFAEEKARVQQQLKDARTVAQIKRKIAKGDGDIDKAAVLQLMQHGVSLEKVRISMFAEVRNAVESLKSGKDAKQARQKIEAIRNLSDNAIAVIIKNGDKLTYDNIYKAKFAVNSNGHSAESNDKSTELMDVLQTEIDKTFAKEGIEKNDETIGAVKLLLEYDLPINKENIEKVLMLKGLSAALGKEGATAEDVSMRLNRAQIQLEMTMNAAKNLAHTGLNVDTDAIKNTVESLETIENERWVASLKFVGADASEENLGKMNRVFTQINQTRQITNNVYADIVRKTVDFTISNVTKAINYAKTLEQFEMFQTVPSVKFGDSFSLVKSQFAPFVENLQLVATDANVKAAEILSRNNMDVTAENIGQVKLIDQKIQYVQNRLHPVIAASIIKDGKDATNMHLDEVIAHIDGFNDKFGVNTKEQIADHMLTLDKQKTLTPQQRAEVIDVYKMLNAVERQNSASLGTIVKNDVDLTLGKMAEAAKYFKETRGAKSALDVAVDENFGMLEKLNSNDFAFRRIVEICEPVVLAQVVAENGDILNLNLEQVAEELEKTRERIATLKTERAENVDETLSAEVVNSSILAQVREEQFLSHLERLAQNVDEPLKLQGLEPTFANISALAVLQKDAGFVSKSLEEFEESDKKEVLETLESAELLGLKEGKIPSELLLELSETLEDLKANETDVKRFDEFSLLQNAIKVTNNLQTKSNLFDIKLPVALTNKIANLRVYFTGKTGNQGELNVAIELDTKNLGDVSAVLSVNGLSASFKCQSKDPLAEAYLQEKLGNLNAEINEIALNDLNINEIKNDKLNKNFVEIVSKIVQYVDREDVEFSKGVDNV